MSQRLVVALWLVLIGCACALPPVRLPPPVGPVTVRIGVETYELWNEVEASPPGRAQRRERLRELFAANGCPERVGAPERMGATAVVCRLPGASPRSIVVASEYDSGGWRRSDGWPGAAMLPGLYHALAVEPRHHTLVFVAFERRLLGPEARSWQLSRALDALAADERAQIAAVVGVRGMDENQLGVVATGADPGLFVDLRAVSQALEIPVKLLRPRRRDDLVGKTAPPLRPDGRVVPLVAIAVAERGLSDYLDSFRFVAALLAYVDRASEMRSEAIRLPE